jgi:DNA-binding transcriptional LysR family regulator
MYFLEISRRGSLSAAARALGVNQTTVGRRLKVLERDLGARLLRTTARGVALTDAGQAVLIEAQKMDETVASLQRKAAGRDAKLEGMVTIATTEALASTFLIPRLAALREWYPRLDFVIAASNHTLDLASGEADLAFRLVQPKQPELIARRVGEIRLGVYAARTYLARHDPPSFATKLAGHEVLGYHGTLATGTEARWLAAHATQARVILRVDSVLNQLAATVAGLGIGVLPDHLVTDPAVVRLDVPSEPDSRGVWVVFHADTRSNVRIKAIVDHLVAQARDPNVFPRASVR